MQRFWWGERSATGMHALLQSLVFFDSGPNTGPGTPGHVGLVIGNGKMVVARCASCNPNIGVQAYNRSDWVGVTRPLARPDIASKLT